MHNTVLESTNEHILAIDYFYFHIMKVELSFINKFINILHSPTSLRPWQPIMEHLCFNFPKISQKKLCMNCGMQFPCSNFD